MLSKIEEKQLEEDYTIFKKGIEYHINALQYYIDIFTANDNRFDLPPDFRGEITKIIEKRIFGEPSSDNIENSMDKGFLNNSIKKLWKKINRK